MESGKDKIMLNTFYDIFNSQFVSACLGALVGVFSTTLIANYFNNKEKTVKEVRALNTAMTLNVDLLNVYLDLKRSNLSPLSQQYEKHCVEYNSKKNCTEKQEINLGSLSFISPPKAFEADLQVYVRDKLDSHFNALQLSIIIPRVKNLLDSEIIHRNELIKNQLNILDLEEWYFGKKDNKGVINNLYKDSVMGMMNYCDDVIFYSMELQKELEKYGRILVKKYKLKPQDILRINLGNLKDLEYYPKQDAERFQSYINSRKRQNLQ